jgi:hypothetical protein
MSDLIKMRLNTAWMLSCSGLVNLATIAIVLLGGTAFAQTVQPVIAEYKVKAEGKFAVTNNTLVPMAVVLEPKSFSITPDGDGSYRALDPAIHVELSTMSFRLEPKQTYYVFYKAKSDKLPAWFTVYSAFTSIEHSSGLDVRILLPHTVYLYQKKQLTRDDVQVQQATYMAKSRKIVCDLQNASSALGRVQEVRVASARESTTAPGFPLLSEGRRHLEVPWNGNESPEVLLVRFEHFTLKQPLNTDEQ